jgi:hypothetical protein
LIPFVLSLSYKIFFRLPESGGGSVIFSYLKPFKLTKNIKIQPETPFFASRTFPNTSSSSGKRKIRKETKENMISIRVSLGEK